MALQWAESANFYIVRTWGAAVLRPYKGCLMMRRMLLLSAFVSEKIQIQCWCMCIGT
jgi:hypothetical protein